jgi:hypothetical protein
VSKWDTESKSSRKSLVSFSKELERTMSLVCEQEGMKIFPLNLAIYDFTVAGK